MKKQERIPMQHPTKKDEFGMPKIQHINPKTVKSGKAAKMGFLPIPKVERAPDFGVPNTPTTPKSKPNPAK